MLTHDTPERHEESVMTATIWYTASALLWVCVLAGATWAAIPAGLYAVFAMISTARKN